MFEVTAHYTFGAANLPQHVDAIYPQDNDLLYRTASNMFRWHAGIVSDVDQDQHPETDALAAGLFVPKRINMAHSVAGIVFPLHLQWSQPPVRRHSTTQFGLTRYVISRTDSTRTRHDHAPVSFEFNVHIELFSPFPFACRSRHEPRNLACGCGPAHLLSCPLRPLLCRVPRLDRSGFWAKRSYCNLTLYLADVHAMRSTICHVFAIGPAGCRRRHAPPTPRSRVVLVRAR